MTALQTLIEDAPAVRFEGNRAQLNELQMRSRDLRVRFGLAAEPIEIDGDQVRVSGICGYLPLGDVTLEVVPHFLAGLRGWRIALLRMIATSSGVQPGPTFRADDVEAPLPDLLGLTVIEALSRGVAEGMPRTYIETQDDLSVIRGQPVMGSVWRQVIDRDVMRCRFTSFTEHHPVNSLLKWTAHDLVTPVTRDWLAGELEMMAQSWSDSPIELPPNNVLDGLEPPQQFDFLRDAIEVGRYLASRPETGSDGRHGGSGRSFVWVTQELIAKFVVQLAKQAARELGGEARTTRYDFETPSELGKRMRPVPAYVDVIIDFEGRPRAMLDVRGDRRAPQMLESDAEAVVSAGDWNGCPDVGIVYLGLEHQASARWNLRADRGPAHLHRLTIDVSELAAGRDVGRIAAVFAEDLAHALLAVPVTPHHSRAVYVSDATGSRRRVQNL